MMHSVPLQEEITMEILSRLPVRPLLRFKCVSTCWMTLISEPYFTLKHRNRAKNDQNSQKFLVSRKDLLEDEFSLYCSSLSSVQRIEEVQKLDCPSNGKPWRSCKLYCCYDSLVLIAVFNYCDKTNQRLLWNPSTRESIILKIDLESCSEILALKSGSWRLTNNYPISNHPDLLCTESLVFVHGAFHWIDNISRSTVTALSISSEVYTEIPLPEKMLSIYDHKCGLLVSVWQKSFVFMLIIRLKWGTLLGFG
ncbi:F-box/kelch-repeat protein like [Capsicum annuum]